VTIVPGFFIKQPIIGDPLLFDRIVYE
jgi:hypothetical protein